MSNIFDLFRKIESKPVDPSPVEWLVVGLGNPGAKYESTRHNAGFLAIDRLADSLGVRIQTAKYNALCADVKIGGVRALLLKPQTFMNLSGEAVRAAADFYKLPPERVLVLCDDVNFDPGVMRIRRKGSAGGQKGVGNIIEKLNSDGFPRIKLGVGRKPHPEMDMADFVLGRLSDADLETMDSVFQNVISAVTLILDGKIDDAMTKYSK